MARLEASHHWWPLVGEIVWLQGSIWVDGGKSAVERGPTSAVSREGGPKRVEALGALGLAVAFPEQ